MADEKGKDGKIVVTFSGDVAILKLCRGQNRINPSFLKKFSEAIDTVERNPSINILVTTGEDRFYSNGLDLEWINSNLDSGSYKPVEKLLQDLNDFLVRFITLPFVTVCAINGHAYAGGAVLSLAHDIRVMQNRPGWWCLNEVHIGMQFTPFLANFIRSKIPSGFPLTEAVILGKRYNAKEAMKSGIIQEVASPETLQDVAVQHARTLIPSNGFKRAYLSNNKHSFQQNIIALKEYKLEGFSKAKL